MTASEWNAAKCHEYEVCMKCWCSFAILCKIAFWLQGKLQFFFGVFFNQVIIKDYTRSKLHMILKSYIVEMCILYEVGSWVIHWACLKDTTCGIWNMQFWHVEILLMEEIPYHLLLLKPYETWNVLNVNWMSTGAGSLPSTVWLFEREIPDPPV